LRHLATPDHGASSAPSRNCWHDEQAGTAGTDHLERFASTVVAFRRSKFKVPATKLIVTRRKTEITRGDLA
jgi:hypothetical protein